MNKEVSSNEATPFPWQQAMQFGFGILRLSPDDFWSMSVRELNMAMMAHYGVAGEPISSAWLEQAMHDYPDRDIIGEAKDGC